MSRLADIIPGATEVVGRRGPEASGDWVEDIINTVDNRIDDLVGFRPLRHFILRPLSSIAPANVIRNLTGLPKPSELIEQMEDEIEANLRRAGAGRALGWRDILPRLPF